MKRFYGAIFDLDGVLVDTARYHYLAWKRLAGRLGFEFTEKDNERLKGVSRMESLDILLGIGGLDFGPGEKVGLADLKNMWYVEYISKIEPSEIFPGVMEFLTQLKIMNIRTALGSASRNANIIINRLKIRAYFDSIVDGNRVTKAKPDPEVFLTASKDIDVEPENCIVFEDAESGIEAAHRAGMYAVGIGCRENLPMADTIAAGLYEVNPRKLFL